MENRTLEKITTILTNLENEKTNEKNKIKAMFEEYKLKVNNSMSTYLEFEREYRDIVRDFQNKFSLVAEISPMETSGIIDYDEVCDVFGTELADEFFSMKIKFSLPATSNMYYDMTNSKGCCMVSEYCKTNDTLMNGWDWVQKNEQKNQTKCGLTAILVEYLDVLYPLFEQKMLNDISTKYGEDFNNTRDKRVFIENTLNMLKSNKNKRTESVKDIVIQKLIESTELCNALFDRAEYTITHMSLTNYAIERVNNMSDTELELIYSDIMGIEDELDEN